jgi:hypothetical protein
MNDNGTVLHMMLNNWIIKLFVVVVVLARYYGCEFPHLAARVLVFMKPKRVWSWLTTSSVSCWVLLSGSETFFKFLNAI